MMQPEGEVVPGLRVRQAGKQKVSLHPAGQGGRELQAVHVQCHGFARGRCRVRLQMLHETTCLFAPCVDLCRGHCVCRQTTGQPFPPQRFIQPRMIAGPQAFNNKLLHAVTVQVAADKGFTVAEFGCGRAARCKAQALFGKIACGVFQRFYQREEWQHLGTCLRRRQGHCAHGRRQRCGEALPVGIEGAQRPCIILCAERLQRQRPQVFTLPGRRCLQVAAQFFEHQRRLAFAVVAHIPALVAEVEGIAGGNQRFQKQVAIVAAARTVSGTRAVLRHQVEAQRRTLAGEIAIVQAQHRHQAKRNRAHGHHGAYGHLPGEKLTPGARGALQVAL